MTRTYVLSLTPEYRSHWSVSDAIRELLQNALDDKSSFEYAFPNNHMIIRNVGVSIPAKTLLLGCTSKGDEEDSVGGFGEGFKIALLILCREGYKVLVRNGERLWTPYFKYSDVYDSDMLHIDEAELEGNLDLTFIIEGVDEELKKEIIDKCLYLQKDLGEVINTENGRILKGMKGKLFVGGLYVTDTNNKYSYDFHPSVLPLNTDRKSVEQWDLLGQTAKMWQEVNDPSFVAEMIKEDIPDVQGMKFYSDESIRSSCFSLYKEEYGNVPIAYNTHDKDSLEKSKGHTNVVVTGNEVFTRNVTESKEYKSIDFDCDERTPGGIISDWADYASVGSTDLSELREILCTFEKRGVTWG